MAFVTVDSVIKHRVELNFEFDMYDRGECAYPVLNPDVVVVIVVNTIGAVASNILDIDYLIPLR